MTHTSIFTSLTRISDLRDKEFEVLALDRSEWATGDYVIGKILEPGSTSLLLELPSGRMRGVIGGEYVVGAFGERFATLEITGTWKKITDDLTFHLLTGAGLFGKLTSKSFFLPQMMKLQYVGHVARNGDKITMESFVKPVKIGPFKTPVVLFIGTSMSAGKTTSARIVANLFKTAGYRVVGAKLTGAGRFKDILAIKDVGASAIFDFVDVGLPSSICEKELFKSKLAQLTSLIEQQKADIAIIEIVASPLESYNGDIAINAIREQIKCTILSATDPYAVYGLMKAFDFSPDLVTGIASNTLAGISMVEQLCNVKALNLIDATTTPELKEILTSKTGLRL
ncbi:MAG: hypothetical protein HKP53_04305 [Eudoraea sp.]|nr:hypothetical protein [Eudoraea sp.]